MYYLSLFAADIAQCNSRTRTCVRVRPCVLHVVHERAFRCSRCSRSSVLFLISLSHRTTVLVQFRKFPCASPPFGFPSLFLRVSVFVFSLPLRRSVASAIVKFSRCVLLRFSPCERPFVRDEVSLFFFSVFHRLLLFSSVSFSLLLPPFPLASSALL